MNINKVQDLLNFDDLYLYCHKTHQYEIATTVVEVIEVGTGTRMRKGIRGLDSEDRKLYNQFSQELYNKLEEKFVILKNIK
jgi:hypothetical protein